MNNVCVSGKIGSGKTRFTRRVFSQYTSQFQYPFHVIEIDSFVKHLHSQPKIQKELYSRWRKNGVVINSVSLKSPCEGGFRGLKNRNKKKILFFSPSQQKRRAWNALESFFHPIITRYIEETVQKNTLKKGTVVWDMALAGLFPQKVSHSHVHISSRSFYPQFFCLKKYRNLSAKEIFWYRNRQR